MPTLSRTLLTAVAMLLIGHAAGSDVSIFTSQPTNSRYADFTTSDRSFTVSGSSTGAVSVTWASDGASGTATGVDSWSFSVGPYVDGVHSITATAHAADGSTAVTGLTVTVDGNAPAIHLIGPLPAPAGTTDSVSATQGDELLVSGTATDAVAVTRVTWTVDQNVLLADGSSFMQQLDYGTASGTTTWSFRTPPLLPGIAAVWVTAENGSGKTSMCLLLLQTVPGRLPIRVLPSPIDSGTPGGDFAPHTHVSAPHGCGSGGGVAAIIATGCLLIGSGWRRWRR